jgi:hypothetical protein
MQYRSAKALRHPRSTSAVVPFRSTPERILRSEGLFLAVENAQAVDLLAEV